MVHFSEYHDASYESGVGILRDGAPRHRVLTNRGSGRMKCSDLSIPISLCARLESNCSHLRACKGPIGPAPNGST